MSLGGRSELTRIVRRAGPAELGRSSPSRADFGSRWPSRRGGHAHVAPPNAHPSLVVRDQNAGSPPVHGREVLPTRSWWANRDLNQRTGGLGKGLPALSRGLWGLRDVSRRPEASRFVSGLAPLVAPLGPTITRSYGHARDVIRSEHAPIEVGLQARTRPRAHQVVWGGGDRALGRA